MQFIQKMTVVRLETKKPGLSNIQHNKFLPTAKQGTETRIPTLQRTGKELQ
jgi:hypothetical protein